jgi:hypothetical protein
MDEDFSGVKWPESDGLEHKKLRLGIIGQKVRCV